MSKAAKPLKNKRVKRLSPLPQDMKALYCRASLNEIIQSMRDKLMKQKSKLDQTAFLKREKMVMDMIVVSEEFVRITRDNARYFKQMTSLSILASQKTSECDKLKDEIKQLEEDQNKETKSLKEEVYFTSIENDEFKSKIKQLENELQTLKNEI
jgi:chromosome segregation ATPase